MPRTRSIRPGFFTNDALGELQPVVRLLFAGLWTVADREGRLLDRPRKLKAELLAYDKIDIDKALDLLAKGGFIQRYQAGDEHCIQIHHWDRHQRPHPREEPSSIPAPQGYPQPHLEPDPGAPPAAPRPRPSPPGTLSSSSGTLSSSSGTLSGSYHDHSFQEEPPTPLDEKTNGANLGTTCCTKGAVTNGAEHLSSCPLAAVKA